MMSNDTFPALFVDRWRWRLCQRLLGLQNLIYLQQESVCDCYHGLLLASRRPTPELVPQSGFLRPRHRPSAFGECRPQPSVATGCVTAKVLAGALLITRTHSRPGTQLLPCRKLLHVRSDFG